MNPIIWVGVILVALGLSTGKQENERRKDSIALHWVVTLAGLLIILTVVGGAVGWNY